MDVANPKILHLPLLAGPGELSNGEERKIHAEMSKKTKRMAYCYLQPYEIAEVKSDAFSVPLFFSFAFLMSLPISMLQISYFPFQIPKCQVANHAMRSPISYLPKTSRSTDRPVGAEVSPTVEYHLTQLDWCDVTANLPNVERGLICIG